MGYTSDFEGEISIEPPLNASEVAYLNKFASTRRMHRQNGPYFVDGSGDFGQGDDPDILDHNYPDPSQPGLWCQWNASDDGSYILWDGGEKFYNSEEWMRYIINHFLKPSAIARSSGAPQFKDFTFDHVCNGTIYVQGEDSSDIWQIVVSNNEVSTKHGVITYV